MKKRRERKLSTTPVNRLYHADEEYLLVFCRSSAKFVSLSLEAKAKKNAWQQCLTILDGFRSRDLLP